jgi:hypothetical protein
MIAATKLLNAVTSTGAGASYVLDVPWQHGKGTSKLTFQGIVTGTGSVSATVLVQVTLDETETYWETLGTITLSGSGSAHDGFAADAPWLKVRGNVSAISGTGAAVTLIQGVQK